jgi:hypothetical protein
MKTTLITAIIAAVYAQEETTNGGDGSFTF